MDAAKQLPRPRTVPDLIAARAQAGGADERPRLTKLLLNVTLQGSLGHVHVVMTPESTVEDLIAAALRQYLKEGRRPILPTADPAGFDLHYSQFSLESKSCSQPFDLLLAFEFIPITARARVAR